MQSSNTGNLVTLNNRNMSFNNTKNIQCFSALALGLAFYELGPNEQS